MLHKLNQLANEFGVAVVVTNEGGFTLLPSDTSVEYTDLGFGGKIDLTWCNFKDLNRPLGGQTLAHACRTRISLRKARGANRIAWYDSQLLNTSASKQVQKSLKMKFPFPLEKEASPMKWSNTSAINKSVM